MDEIYPGTPLRDNENLSRAEIFEKLRLHLLWLNEDLEEGVQGYFSYVNFSGMTINGSNFSNCNFSYANFSEADFSNCTFERCNFIGADFTNANLTNANVRYSNFVGATLTGTNLTNTNIGEVTGNGKEIKTLYACKHIVNYTSHIITAGCLTETINWWTTATYENFLEKYNSSDSEFFWNLMQTLGIPIVTQLPALETINNG